MNGGGGYGHVQHTQKYERNNKEDIDIKEEVTKESDSEDGEVRGSDLEGGEVRESDSESGTVIGSELESGEVRESALGEGEVRESDIENETVIGSDLEDIAFSEEDRQREAGLCEQIINLVDVAHSIRMQEPGWTSEEYSDFSQAYKSFHETLGSSFSRS